MQPETVGVTHTRLVLGKHSGRAALGARLAELGYPLDPDALARVFERFKALADRRKHVSDADLEALVRDDLPVGEAFTLAGLHVSCGTLGMPTATVRLTCPDGTQRVHASIGTGPVDAVYKAIDALAGMAVNLREYSVHSVTEGIDALGHVTVRVHDDRGRVFHGAGADTDIIVASAQAYLRALSRSHAAREGMKTSPQSWHGAEAS
jgi:2-isopropylmalate synthase